MQKYLDFLVVEFIFPMNLFSKIMLCLNMQKYLDLLAVEFIFSFVIYSQFFRIDVGIRERV